MSQNPSPSMLDAGQIVKRVFDETNDAVRVEVGSGTTFNVSLDSSDSIVVLGTEDGTPSGTPHAVTVDANKNLHVLNMGQLVPKVFDATSATYPTSSQEVYSYFTGGLAGTLVATVTVNYTDNTKTVFLNVART